METQQLANVHAQEASSKSGTDTYEDQTMGSPGTLKPVKGVPKITSLPTSDQELAVDCDCGVHVIGAVSSGTHSLVFINVNLSG